MSSNVSDSMREIIQRTRIAYDAREPTPPPYLDIDPLVLDVLQPAQTKRVPPLHKPPLQTGNNYVLIGDAELAEYLRAAAVRAWVGHAQQGRAPAPRQLCVHDAVQRLCSPDGCDAVRVCKIAGQSDRGLQAPPRARRHLEERHLSDNFARCDFARRRGRRAPAARRDGARRAACVPHGEDLHGPPEARRHVV
ncbi:hypothetical protein FA95DRAFT_777858 [Auriscalpium vulgare]|uniref:Uncharacterized protein n=1 Tax=Auriscalpium vulgare TaxID=40419 RepID=A0ACB8S174_9AGAM|nr:hypothetical protein FA95DRAFT_777858 [Auriscalpium vulgare]